MEFRRMSEFLSKCSTDCCSNGSGLFNLADFVAGMTIGIVGPSPKSSSPKSSTKPTTPPTSLLPADSLRVSISTSASTPILTASPIPTRAPSRLSTGAKAGIGIGVPLGLVVVGLLIFIFARQQRRLRTVEERLQLQSTYTADDSSTVVTISGSTGQSMETPHKVELPGHPTD
ncbi:MAG: hypothetical protein M1813_008683 [Trichoglossum hirsutum]|nr:MAG: hypothetical protein M1813_008683 [Trichoglossum hirsutum]